MNSPTRVQFNLADGAGVDELVAIAWAALSVEGVAESMGLPQSATLLYKALKVGGPAHAGRTVAQVERDSKAAGVEVAARQQRYGDELLEDVLAWKSACALHAGAIEKMGKDAADSELATIRKSIERSMRTDIRNNTRAMWILGRHAAGNFGPVTKDEINAMNRLQRDEQQHAANMFEDILQGTYRMPLARRVGLYQQALIEAYWCGFVMSDLSHDRYLQWDKTGGESCTDCVALANGGRFGNGVYRALELAKKGLVPRCSKLCCYGGCRCELKEVGRPAGKADGLPLENMTLLGPTGDVFHGNGRVGREKYEKQVKRSTWKWNKRK